MWENIGCISILKPWISEKINLVYAHKIRETFKIQAYYIKKSNMPVIQMTHNKGREDAVWTPASSLSLICLIV